MHLVAGIVVALLGLGCAGRGDVSGKVRYEGKPLVWGTVQFEARDGSLSQGNIGSDGSYSIRGVSTGEVKAAVSSRNPKSSDFIPIEKEGGRKFPSLPEVQGWFAIPPRYEDFSSSGLTYLVKPGENTIDIELKK